MYEIFIHDHTIKLFFPKFELKLICESNKIISQSLIRNGLGLIMIFDSKMSSLYRTRQKPVPPFPSTYTDYKDVPDVTKLVRRVAGLPLLPLNKVEDFLLHTLDRRRFSQPTWNHYRKICERLATLKTELTIGTKTFIDYGDAAPYLLKLGV